MATFRTKKRASEFVTLDKTSIYDSNLSYKAKGILLYLLSRPDDWQIYETELVKHTSDGRDSVRSGLKELEDHGYIVRSRKRDKKGRLGEYEYIVYERPNHIGLSNVGKTNIGLSNVGKSNTTNNKDTNNDLTKNNLNILSSDARPYEEIIRYLNKKAGKNFSSTTETTRKFINGRLNEGKTIDDFKKVIDIKTDEWLNTESEKYLRPSTLFRPGNFENYLNQKPVMKKSNMDQVAKELGIYG